MADRLQKIMAQSGLGSRRNCESLIDAGRVTLNGKQAKLGDKATRDDTILVDGKPIQREKRRYIMLYKPRDVLSSTEDELGEGRRTVRDLVDVPGHLYPVGRLDKNSIGLILLTNDGRLANKLTHPKYQHDKIYSVWVEGQVSDQTLKQWRHGVMLDEKMTAPARVAIDRQEPHRTRLRIIMREGRKRQIRRVAALLGHEVRFLKRTQIGPLKLSRLELGEWRDLTAAELSRLRKSVAFHDKRLAADEKSGKAQSKLARRKSNSRRR